MIDGRSTKRTRKPSISKCLVNNSRSALLAAIEIHNKPVFKYRYEVCVLLIINAWELLLKAYIHKYMKHVRLFRKDGTTKPFNECLECVSGELGNSFLSSYHSLALLYKHRNSIAHFYSEEMDVIIFSLLKPNVLFYSRFIKQHFKIDLAAETGLILLPIGFTKPYSPVDFISNRSSMADSPTVLKEFIADIVSSTKSLLDAEIEEPIIVDFKISLINEKRVKNADIIAGINNQLPNTPFFTVQSKPNTFKVTDDDPNVPTVRITRDKANADGILLHEELSDGLFAEINNVIDANRLLAGNSAVFILGEKIYFRIYAERHHVVNDPQTLYMLANSALSEIYSPFLYWVLKLPPNYVAQLIFDFMERMRSPHVRALIKLSSLLSVNILEWLFNCFDNKWRKHPQPPDYYWTIKGMLETRKTSADFILSTLQMSAGSSLSVPGEPKGLPLHRLLADDRLANDFLTQSCMRMFAGKKQYRPSSRALDLICHAKQLQEIGLKVEQEMTRSIRWHRFLEKLTLHDDQKNTEHE
jgi:hypothetical protein